MTVEQTSNGSAIMKYAVDFDWPIPERLSRSIAADWGAMIAAAGMRGHKLSGAWWDEEGAMRKAMGQSTISISGLGDLKPLPPLSADNVLWLDEHDRRWEIVEPAKGNRKQRRAAMAKGRK